MKKTKEPAKQQIILEYRADSTQAVKELKKIQKELKEIIRLKKLAEIK